ncbi:L-aspartate oxidase [Sporosarcina siberiensis]|uniref:L-aspartate oxidase n=1 Tax=Sporosarcina siberiensis TaxID=1365606 RepID=A0ABW4SH29_9BACL
MKKYNHIIIGSGIAALQLASNLNKSSKVLIITKSKLNESNSYRAQGGIAAAIGNLDHPSFHYKDTLKAGCYFQNENAVMELAENGPRIIENLKGNGLTFDEDDCGNLSLGMEGAHSQNRILHCGGDATGKHIMNHLFSEIHPQIDIIENEFVFELILNSNRNRCIGIKSMDENGEVHYYSGQNIILAVGGVGGMFSYTSNEQSIAGDGIALAYRAGAEIVDMEFIQFHPTLLFVDGETKGLISEAVRGSGARLITSTGAYLMDGKHTLGDLAPRHIVAKEIFDQRAAGVDVFLDISMISEFEKKFPTVSKICLENGVAIKTGLIPVAPGCHFLMGGISVNEVGETSVNGLFAIGETASTGIHGANRLASNSLLEGLYFGEKLAMYLNKLNPPKESLSIIEKEFQMRHDLFIPNVKEVQQQMMLHAGIIRTKLDLLQIESWLNQFSEEENALDKYSKEQIQVLFMVQCAKLIVKGALLREESRGGHIREDFSSESQSWKEMHIVQSNKGIEMRRRTNERHKVEIHA